MMTAGRRALLDTSTVIIAPRLEGLDPRPDEFLISAITLAELSAGPVLAPDDHTRSTRQMHLQLAESDFQALPFDADCARAFAAVSVSLRSSGRNVGARAYDALIAATAIAHGMPLYTCNPQDFAGIEGLTVVAIATL